MKLIKTFLLTACVLTIWLTAPQSHAQGTTAFTYQGQLRDGGTNANGTYTMTFKLYDAATGTNQIGGAITNSPTLANGLFSVNLDFGSGVFHGQACWLDITVQNGPIVQTLTPRVQITPAPYALYALASGSTSTNGTITAGTINATNIVLGGGGTSWDLSIDASGALAIAYGDPLVTWLLGPDGILTVRSNIVVDNGDFVAPRGGLQLGNSTVWDIRVGNFQAPGGGPLLNDALILSAAGIP